MRRRLLLVVGGTATALLAAGAGSGRQTAPPSSHWTIRNLGTLSAPYSRNSEADRINDRGQVLGWSSGFGARYQGVVWWHGGRSTLRGGTFVQPAAMNAHGDVVGLANVTGDARGHLFLWRHDPKRIDLTSRYGIRGEITDINDSGEIVGTMQATRFTTHAFLLKAGRVTDLGTLGGKNSSASAINNRGEIVGQSDTPSGSSHAFAWRSGKMGDLGTFSGEDSAATAINDRGDVIGYAHVGPYDADHALLWRGGRMIVLTGFGPGGLFPREITNHGVVLVNSINPERSFLWHQGRVTALGSLGGGATVAHDVNEHSVVVGSSKVAAIHRAAFVWSHGKMTRLPALAPGGGPPYTTAYAINDRGQIVGGSYVGRIGRERAVLWTFHR